MDMDFTDFRVAGAAGMTLVGVLITVGAFVVSFLVAGVIRTGLAVAKWLAGMQAHPSRATVDALRGVEKNVRLTGAADHALLARQAWWRLRC
jgi:ABC-type amino acid transport system permease subunit